jgi:Fe-Mn family superoxide dismutase
MSRFHLPSIDFKQSSFLDSETLEFHYGKHHKAYVDNLNKLVDGQPVQGLVEIIQNSSGGLFNNAAQAWNHTFYWMCLTPTASALRATSALAQAINRDFGSLENCQAEFEKMGASNFGSGWTWLAKEKASQKLSWINTSNAHLVDLKTHIPILVADVWEHAYYIKYRNARPQYLKDFWAAVNWTAAEKFFETDDVSAVEKSMTA